MTRTSPTTNITRCSRAQKIAGDIDRAADTISEFVPADELGIIVDEWGAWHPEAVSDNGLEQANTVRDAVATAGVLDLIHDRADVVSMANIAQTVNVLQCLVQTDEESAWRTPTFHVFDLYENHIGQTALETSIDTDAKSFDDEDHDVPMVSASASEGDGELFVTASNRRHAEAETITVDVGTSDYSVSAATVLFEGNDVREYSTKENAESFEGTDWAVSPTSRSLKAVSLLSKREPIRRLVNGRCRLYSERQRRDALTDGATAVVECVQPC